MALQWVILAGFALGIVCAVGGCAARIDPSPSPVDPGASSPQTLETNGDWDDLDPAIGYALGRTELVRVRADRSTSGRLVVALWSSRDEPGELVIVRLDPADTPDPVRIAMTCRVGRFGDPAQERQLMQLIARRLEQLRGVEVAPAS